MYVLIYIISDDDGDDDEDGGNGAFQSDAFRARSKAMRFLRVPKRGPYLGNCDIVKSKTVVMGKVICVFRVQDPSPSGWSWPIIMVDSSR